MHGQRSVVFDVGMTTVGAFLLLTAVLWFWPFDESLDGVAWPLVAALVVSYAAVRAVDRLARWVEVDVTRAFRWVIARSGVRPPPDAAPGPSGESER